MCSHFRFWRIRRYFSPFWLTAIHVGPPPPRRPLPIIYHYILPPTPTTSSHTPSFGVLCALSTFCVWLYAILLDILVYNNDRHNLMFFQNTTAQSCLLFMHACICKYMYSFYKAITRPQRRYNNSLYVYSLLFYKLF